MKEKIRMKIKTAFLASGLLLLIFICSKPAFAEEDSEIKNILILNSYHQGLDWAKEEVNGIVDTLEQSGRNISTMIEYLDWKNYPAKENLAYLKNYYEYKYQDKKIDIIITTDDAALKFALENREDIFSNAPVVFCGVNKNGVDKITVGYDNITGVIEVIDPTETIKIALNINPDIKNIYLLYDNSESGQSTGHIVLEKIMSMDRTLHIIPCNNMVYEDLIQKVQALDKNSIVLITTYYRDVTNRIIEMDYVIREISLHSNVPVYHIYDFGLDNGILGGVMLSGRLQGENAANLAIRILQGEDMAKIPIIEPESTRTAFDYEQLQRFQISRKSLPKDSEIINQPFSFFETYRSLVLSVISTFLILIVFVGILLFYIRKIHRMKQKLSDSHNELSQIYDDLTASDEEIRQQYDEMILINEKIRLGEEKLSYLAYYDTLTGLPNKHSLYENAKFIFCEDKGKTALLFIDIDNFKYVNDSLGHAFGDQLIIKVSERLVLLIEKKGSIYRLSGDEFIMILDGIRELSEAENFASKIIEGFNEEFDIMGSILHISLSFGIVLYPEHAKDLEQLLKYADMAMYQAKENGRKSYAVYDYVMNQELTERVNIEKYLHDALGNNEFELYYQPQLDLITRRITGLEALLRWKSPELGNVSPLKFIRVAEDTHDIIPLGTWVLKQACAFLNKLHREGFDDLTMSVNISVLQLLQSDFNDIVVNTLREFELDPQFLELEITETILMESFESIVIRLEQLREQKIRIALDDFGKGYSSLNYLKQLPIHTLKIDKSFIDDITDKDCDTITGHIVTIGKSMGMCIVAEGVERQEQQEYLIQHECDKIQGYLFSKPVSEEEVLHRLELNQGDSIRTK